MFTVTIKHRGDEHPTEYKIYEKEEMDSKPHKQKGKKNAKISTR